MNDEHEMVIFKKAVEVVDEQNKHFEIEIEYLYILKSQNTLKTTTQHKMNNQKLNTSSKCKSKYNILTNKLELKRIEKLK